MQNQDFHISDNAANHLANMAEVKAGQYLRIMVEGGGCAGFQYIFSFTDNTEADDLVFEKNGIKVVIDKASLPFIQAGELDFEEKLMGQYFHIKNPNAKGGCGCGNSFAIE